LDELINNPFVDDLVTYRALDKIVYQDQRAIGGSAIKEGKVIGSSATVDEKGVTLTIGSNILKKRYAIQTILKGSSEEGFVDVFSSGKYQRTLGFGGTGLLFLPNLSNRYTERTRKDLHHQLRQLRREDSTKWDGLYIPSEHYQWEIKYTPIAAAFVAKWDAFQAWLSLGTTDRNARFYVDSLTSAEEAELAGQATYIAYLKAETAISILLPKDWDTFDQVEEQRRLRYNEEQRQIRLTTYDSIQVKSQWTRRH
jgi:hypothetical protein